MYCPNTFINQTIAVFFHSYARIGSPSSSKKTGALVLKECVKAVAILLASRASTTLTGRATGNIELIDIRKDKVNHVRLLSRTADVNSLTSVTKASLKRS